MFIVLVTVVIVSNDGVINVSCSEKAAPLLTIDQRGIASKLGEVQLKFTPLTVCWSKVVAVGFI